jgi:hypothetical protein
MNNINRIDDEIKKTKGLIEVLDEELKKISNNDAIAYIHKSINDLTEKIFFLKILKELFEAQDKEISYLKENIKLIKENMYLKVQTDILDNLSEEESSKLVNMLFGIMNTNQYKEIKEKWDGFVKLEYIEKFRDTQYGVDRLLFNFKAIVLPGTDEHITRILDDNEFPNLEEGVFYHNIDKLVKLVNEKLEVHEFKVGDGVVDKDDNLNREWIITRISDCGYCTLIRKNDGSSLVVHKSKLQKTGNHYDQVAKLITAK